MFYKPHFIDDKELVENLLSADFEPMRPLWPQYLFNEETNGILGGYIYYLSNETFRGHLEHLIT